MSVSSATKFGLFSSSGLVAAGFLGGLFSKEASPSPEQCKTIENGLVAVAEGADYNVSRHQDMFERGQLTLGEFRTAVNLSAADVMKATGDKADALNSCEMPEYAEQLDKFADTVEGAQQTIADFVRKF